MNIEKHTPVIVVGIIGVIAISYMLFSKQEPQSNESISENPTSDAVAKDTQQASGDSEILGQHNYSTVPDNFLEEDKTYFVTLSTDMGSIKIKLFQNETPVAANNFAFLANDGFYDGLIFHRVIKDFMIQGGDPLGNGTGGPGYAFEDEPITRDYTRGTIAYANSGPNTNGSQFFIMHQDYPLRPQYVIFGEVVEGMDVVDKIATTETVPNSFGEASEPVTPVVIEKATLTSE